MGVGRERGEEGEEMGGGGQGEEEVRRNQSMIRSRFLGQVEGEKFPREASRH